MNKVQYILNPETDYNCINSQLDFIITFDELDCTVSSYPNFYVNNFEYSIKF